MTNTVRIVASVEDHVSGELSKIRDKFDLLGKGAASSTLIGVAGAKALGFGMGLLHEAVGSVVGAITDAVTAGSNLNETLNKSEVVFGGASAEIRKFGEGAARSMGLSEDAAIGAAATFGNLFKSLGTAPEKIAPMSESLVKLAADLASFNNIPVEEALQKLQSGIVGQERPLRELGVAISAAGVDAEAANLGFKKINGTFTEGEKVQARYSLIFKQTGTAQGDFARTSGEMANQQRILDAELANTSEQLGQRLVPAVRDTQRALIELFDTINSHKAQTGAIGDTITHLVNDSTSSHLAELKDAKAALEAGLGQLGGMSVPIIGQLFGSGEKADLEARLAEVNKEIANFRYTGSNDIEKFRSDLSHTFVGVAGDAETMDQSLRSSFSSIVATTDTVSKAHLKLAADVDTANRRIRATYDLTVGQLKKNASDLIHEAFDPIIEHDRLVATNAEIAAKKKIAASAKSTAAEKADARSALDQLHMDQAQYLVDLSKTSQRTSAAYKTGVSELKDEIKHATGPTKTYLQGILDQLTALDSINATPTVTVKIYGAAPLTTLAKQLGYIGNTDLYKKALASGGPVAPGELYQVGEKGPEWFVSDKAGRILPHGVSPTSAGSGSSVSGGSMVLNLTVNAAPGMSPGDGRALATALLPPLVAEMRRQGFLPRTATGLTG